MTPEHNIAHTTTGIAIAKARKVTITHQNPDSRETPEPEKREDARPEQLFTERAMHYWHALQQAGLVDQEFQPIGLTKAQKMYIADLFSEKLRLRYKWSHFERLWQVKELSKAKTEMHNTGTLPRKSDIIDKVFI